MAGESRIRIGNAGKPIYAPGGVMLPNPSGGDIYYVNSTTGASASNGLSPTNPKATLAQALALATAGDTIYVAAGHAESIATAVAFSTSGVTVTGEGTGTTLPSFTVTATVDGFNVTAADVVIENIRFVTPSAVATAQINIAAANCRVSGCRFEMGANARDAITVTADGELPIIEGCEVFVAANGPDTWIEFEGVIDRPLVFGNKVIGSDGTNAFDTGVLDFNSQAITNPMVFDNYFNGADVATTVIAGAGSLVGDLIGPNAYGGAAVDADNVGGGSANLSTLQAALYGAAGIAAFPNAAIPANDVSLAEVIRQIYAALEGTAAGQNGVATWPAGAAPANGVSIAEGLRDVWDAVRNGTGGAEPATNRSVMDYLGVTPAFFVPGLGYAVSKVEDTNAAGDDLFTVTGKVLVTGLFGEVTNALGAGVVADYVLSIKTTSEPLCAATTITSDAVGTMYSLSGDVGDTLNAGSTPTTRVADINGKGPVHLAVGLAGGTDTISSVHTDTGDAGDAITWTLFYLPLEAGASVAAAA